MKNICLKALFLLPLLKLIKITHIILLELFISFKFLSKKKK